MFTVGVLLPDNTNPYFAEIARALEDACFHRGYSVIICNTEQDPGKELEYLRILREKQVEGLVFVSTGDDPEAIEALASQSIRSVIVDRSVETSQFDLVVTDNELGAYRATRHLIELGHRHIDCIAGNRGVASAEARLSGYRRALDEAGAGGAVLYGDFQVESGYEAFKTMYDSGNMPTAVFAGNDLMAFGVLHGAAEQLLRVPYDLSVAGFDDIQLSRFAVPALTTVRQPTQEMATKAIELLLGDDAERRTEPRRLVLEPELIVRASTGPPGAGTG
jgi:LacI family transcriptional regulator